MTTNIGNGRMTIRPDILDILLEFDSDGIAMAKEINRLRHELLNTQTAAICLEELVKILQEGRK